MSEDRSSTPTLALTCPTDVFVRALRATSRAASKDPMRIHLASVWVRGLDETTAHMWATNGHWLLVANLRGATVTKPGLVPIEMRDVAKVIAAAPKSGKRSPTPPPLALARDGVRLSLSFGGLSELVLRAHDHGPPPVHTVVPAGLSTKKHARRTINLEILRPACEAFADMTTGRLKGVKFYAMGPSEIDPVIIWSPYAEDIFALAMPMRAERKRDMKWWTDHAKKLASLTQDGARHAAE